MAKSTKLSKPAPTYSPDHCAVPSKVAAQITPSRPTCPLATADKRR
ncbi:hypothetical protein GCM10009757_36670 [Streptomyces cheonanensis]|uniref:Uncharacterized protein n=2 Tax=Streptomyces TaxID=1883 RepID=A0A1I6PMC4_9ACTN|nr:hypothetical protein SAMN05444716_101604 [Streptomyces harbinensis]